MFLLSKVGQSVTTNEPMTRPPLPSTLPEAHALIEAL
jgi:hypothetical protein